MCLVKVIFSSALFLVLLLHLDQSFAIKYSEDWSKKFVSVKELRQRRLHPRPQFYDPKWAWKVMNEARNATISSFNYGTFFEAVERNVYEDIMRNHIGMSSMGNYAMSDSFHYPQIASCSAQNDCHVRQMTYKLKAQPQKSKVPQQHKQLAAAPARPLQGRFVNASAVALLSFLYLLNLTQVIDFRPAEATLDLYPYQGGYSVMGVDSDSAVGLLGLLLFINLLRDVIQTVTNGRRRRRKRSHE